jgi:hypothetical protein
MTSHILKPARAALMALLLVLAFTTATATATSASADSTKATANASTTTSPSAKASGLKKWKCGKWKGNGGVGWRYCAKITSHSGKFSADYTETQFNKFRHQTISFTCSQSKSKTWTFGATATVKAEAGVIFAKAETSLSASISRSTTTTDTTSGTFKIKPRHWAHCKRGTYVYKWSGLTKKVTCDSSGCVTSDVRSYTAHAPTRAAWFIGPGRG